MNENVKIFIIATLVLVFMLVLPSLIDSAKLLSPETGFADEKAAEEILDDKSNNLPEPILKEDVENEQEELLDNGQKVDEDVMPEDEFDTIIKPKDDN